MVSLLQLASIRMTECTTSFCCNGHSESFIGAPTGQLELDQLHLFNKNTNRCVCLSHNCSVVFPLNFKTPSDKLWRLKQIFGRSPSFRRGLILKIMAVSHNIVFPIGQVQFLHCFEKYREYLRFVLFSLRPKPLNISPPSTLSFPPCRIMNYLRWFGCCGISPQTFDVYDSFPFTRWVNCTFFYLFIFPPWELIARVWIISP